MKNAVNNKELAQKIEAIKRRGTRNYISKQKEEVPYAKADCLSLGGKGDMFCTGNTSFGVGFGMDEGIVLSDLAAIAEFVQVRNKIEHVHFEVTPFCDPLVLMLLQERGYTLDRFFAVWVLELETWQPSEKTFHERNVTIEQVSGENVYEWAWTVALGVSRDNMVSEEMMEATRIFLEVENNVGFLLKEKGISAAGGTLAIEGALGELFLTSTVQAYRGRGYQNLLIQERLHYAKAKGCTHVTVTTEPNSASARNMERNGFQLMYNKAVLRSPVSR